MERLPGARKAAAAAAAVAKPKVQQKAKPKHEAKNEAKPQHTEKEAKLQVWAPNVGKAIVAKLQTQKGKQSKKKQRDKKKNDLKCERVEELQTAIAKAECVVGIDLSITSPGLTIYNKTKNRWKFVGCVHKVDHLKRIATWNGMRLKMKLHEQPNLPEQTVELYVFPECTSKKFPNNTARFEAITQELYLQIQLHCPLPSSTLVVIEDYAYDAFGSRKLQMAEEAGVMQNKLSCGGYPFLKIVPMQTKMWFSGNGFARKEMMWNRFMQVQTGVDFKSLIPTTWPAAGKVPSPHSDLADAFGLVYGSLWPKKTKGISKKRRVTAAPAIGEPIKKRRRKV